MTEQCTSSRNELVQAINNLTNELRNINDGSCSSYNNYGYNQQTPYNYGSSFDIDRLKDSIDNLAKTLEKITETLVKA